MASRQYPTTPLPPQKYYVRLLVKAVVLTPTYFFWSLCYGDSLCASSPSICLGGGSDYTQPLMVFIQGDAINRC